MKQETKDRINEHFRRTLGMSYDEFALLDTDVQQRLIREYHEKHSQKKSDTEIVMIGSGENALFVKVKKGKRVFVTSGDHSIVVRAGETKEEQEARLNKYFDSKIRPIDKAKQMVKRIRGRV